MLAISITIVILIILMIALALSVRDSESDPRVSTSFRSTVSDRATLYSELLTFLIDYLEDKSCPFGKTPDGSSRLFSDLCLDSLDMAEVMRDVSYVTNTTLSFPEFNESYGPDPTITDLAHYVYHKMTNADPSTTHVSSGSPA